MEAVRVEGKNGVAYRAQVMVNGVRKSFTRKLKSKAEEAAVMHATNTRKKMHGEVISVPFRVAMEQYLDNEKSAENATSKCRGALRTILKQWDEIGLAKKQMDKIDKADVKRWIEEREGMVEGATIRRQFNDLRAMFTICQIDHDMLTNSPFNLVRRPDDCDERRRGVRPAEFEAMLKELGYTRGMTPTTDEHYVGAAMIIARETAMRKGEILSLSNDDNTFRRPGEFFLETTKNGHSRTVPIFAGECEAVVATLPKTGKLIPVCSSTFSKVFAAARTRLGLIDEKSKSYWRFHDLRCEAITLMAAPQADGQPRFGELTVSLISGHRDLKTLRDHYYNLNAASLRHK